MKKFFTLFAFIFCLGFSFAQSPIISQYYEGSSNNKWIEITNSTTEPIDLSGYYLCLFANSAADDPANSSPNATYTLTGSLASAASMLFQNSQANDPTYASGTNTAVCSFNGDDLVIISTSKSGTACWADRTDVIGNGTMWGKDKSFYRNSDIYAPNTTYTTGEWTQVTIATVDNASAGTTERLGEHILDALGVSLYDFSIKTLNNATLISWQTLAETNNDYFSIEWSKDGKNFTEIAKIAGAGTSREKQDYRYTHTNPLNGVNYYRLTQYDFDGRSETFDVVSVTLETDKLGMLIAPNRVENNLRIEFTEPVENGRLHIYDMGGQSVQSFILARGIDIFNFDISGMVKGQYIAKYIDDKGIITKKFLKI